MNQTASPTFSAPIDVRLMNISAAVLGVGLVVAAAVGMARWAVRHPVFAIARITVQGDTVHNNEATLRANVASRLQGNFFTLDLGQARAAFETVPWVRKAVVHREFPNQLRVNLQEHQGAALWGVNSESRLVNTFGEVFEANAGDVESEDLPRLIGPEGQGSRVLEAHRTLSTLFAPLDASIEEIELTGRGGWRMQLDGGAVIEMGHGSLQELMVRVKRFTETYTQVLSAYQRTGLDRIELVDLRHNEGYAIRLRGVTAVVVAPGPEKK
jgi:cell division protein FtsQ